MWLKKTEDLAARYHERRESVEGFEKPFVMPTPQYLFYKTLFCYPLRAEQFFYMSLSEYTALLLASERETAEDEGWESVKKAITSARRDGFVKDPPLVASEILPLKDGVEEVLSTYPINKILLYAELGRRYKAEWRWGHRKKSAIGSVLASKPVEWHEFQAIKYRTAYRDLLRMVHPRPPDEAVEKIWGWVLGKRESPTEKIKSYEEMRKLAGKGDYEKALRLAIDAYLPWEVLRSRIKIREVSSGELLREAIAKLMTSNDVALQARTIASMAGTDFLMEIAKKRAFPLNATARAAIGLEGEAGEVFFEKAKMERGEFEKLLPERPERIVSLVDTSGSMRGPRIQSAARILMPFRSIVEKFYEFNEVVGQIELRTLQDFRNLTRLPRDGTKLYDSIIMVSEAERLTEDDLLFVVTDEQENFSGSRLEDVLRLKARIALAVVAPYPADMILKAPHTRIVAYPAADPDAFIASARAIMAGKVAESKKVVKLAELIPLAYT
jgi:hypothetical protein